MHSHHSIARRGLLTGAALLAVRPARAQPSIDRLNARMMRREHYFQALDEAAPDFELQDDEGHTVGLHDLLGNMVVLNFIYTHCPDVCPLQTERMALIQRMVQPTVLRDRIRFVSVTTDPVNDTPDVMKAYGEQHGMDRANWLFLTSGPDHPDVTRDLSVRYHNRFRQEADGSFTHGTVFHVIDGDGRLRGNFHGLDWKPDNLVFYLRALADQGRKPAGGVFSSFWTSLEDLF